MPSSVIHWILASRDSPRKLSRFRCRYSSSSSSCTRRSESRNIVSAKPPRVCRNERTTGVGTHAGPVISQDSRTEVPGNFVQLVENVSRSVACTLPEPRCGTTMARPLRAENRLVQTNARFGCYPVSLFLSNAIAT